MTTKKTLKKLLKDYQFIFENLGFKINPNFKKDFLHIARMKTNSTKISFIKADKIEGLKNNIPNFKLKPNDNEQRDKYFTAVKPSRFLNSLVYVDNEKQDLFNKICERFTKDFISNIKSKLVLYSGYDIGEQYNENNVVGCMSRQSKNFFDVYAKTENLQLATLKDDNDTLLIRALLWHDKKHHNYWLDNSYEQSTLNGDNELRKEYQKKLLCKVLENLITKDQKIKTILRKNNIVTFGFGCKFADCLDAEVVQEIEQKYKIKIYKGVKNKTSTITHTDTEGKETERETEQSKDKILLKPIIKDFDYFDFEAFPYSDTFQSISRNSGGWVISDNEGNSDFVCCLDTEGQDKNNFGEQCECCEERFHSDEMYYSEVEGESLCEHCCVYIDERDDYCRENNATYNNYTEQYIYSYDLN
jgi:hypothetical protein